jgi:hypothetical protein
MSNFIIFSKTLLNTKFISKIYVDYALEGIRWNKKKSFYVKAYLHSGFVDYFVEEYETIEKAQKRFDEIAVEIKNKKN